MNNLHAATKTPQNQTNKNKKTKQIPAVWLSTLNHYFSVTLNSRRQLRNTFKVVLNESDFDCKINQAINQIITGV